VSAFAKAFYDARKNRFSGSRRIEYRFLWHRWAFSFECLEYRLGYRPSARFGMCLGPLRVRLAVKLVNDRTNNGELRLWLENRAVFTGPYRLEDEL